MSTTMQHITIENLSRSCSLGTRIRVADRWWSRLRGLLLRPPLRRGEGLLLRPCRAVHTFGMPGPIDVALLDREGRVVAVYPALPPGRRTQWHAEAAEVLELPAGTLHPTGTQVGDHLRWASVPISLPAAARRALTPCAPFPSLPPRPGG